MDLCIMRLSETHQENSAIGGQCALSTVTINA
jgi:hypothetical protein